MQNYREGRGTANETVDWIDAYRGRGTGQPVDAARVHAGAGGSWGHRDDVAADG